MKEVSVFINDSDKFLIPVGKTYYEVLKEKGLLENTIGILVNNKIANMADTIENDCKIKTITLNDNDGNRIYIAGLKMAVEYAVRKALVGSNVEFKYNIPKGIVTKINYKKDLYREDIIKIKKELNTLIEQDIRFEKLIIKNGDGAKFYAELGNKIKEENINNIIDQTVVLYRLGDLVNYYYSEMPYSTRFLTDYDIKLYNKNTIVVSCPMDGDDSNILEFNEYKEIFKAYDNGIEWLKIMNVPTISYVNRLIWNSKINNFIKSCELNFNTDINKIASTIAKNKSIKCVMLTGPSASGKTTVTKRLANYLEIYGYDPIVISLDGYYVDRVNNPKDENGEYDFECLEACDIDYLSKDIVKLFNGETINLPDFNFITGKRELTDTKVKLNENSIILFEGLHAINDNLLPMIPSNIKYKIYISPFIPLAIDEHNYISSDELRLVRRIIRDYMTRGYDVETTLKNWKKVHLGEEKYILPHVNDADVVLNTSLPYEVGALKVIAEPLLFAVSSDSKYYNQARRLLGFLKQFFTINTECVPKDSIIREFIGGNND